jgi:hypothetical protein
MFDVLAEDADWEDDMEKRGKTRHLVDHHCVIYTFIKWNAKIIRR